MKIRLDVDYPYPSRIKSFLYTGLSIKTKKEYLKNSKIIARMINESHKKVRAYWFFTFTTLPDQEMLALLNNPKHEMALHVINDPYDELKKLNRLTKKVKYYTIHGSKNLLARIIWKRWRKVPQIPPGFPLRSFHQFPTKGVDVFCYSYENGHVQKMIEKIIEKGYVLHMHPIWLFQRGKINQRGPFYSSLRRILEVDKELETLRSRKRFFFTIARNAKEYLEDVIPSEILTEKIREMGVDIFTFIERKWCFTLPKTEKIRVKVNENVALLEIHSFNDWWKKIGKKTRNMVRKAEKSGIETEKVVPNEKMAEGIWRIYNETPIRQNRSFPHYGMSLIKIQENIFSLQNTIHIGAYFDDELVGFIQLIYDSNFAMISQILSLKKHWNKAVNNALIAKAVHVYAARGIKWLMYGRMGNHPSLDKFKRNNGFVKFPLSRYFVVLTKKGKLAIKLGMHREMKDTLPESIKYPLIPIYNWLSRTKLKIRCIRK